eukprot:scaffold104600_cov34-Tisochrysis_lutea.AAC.4
MAIRCRARTLAAYGPAPIGPRDHRRHACPMRHAEIHSSRMSASEESNIDRDCADAIADCTRPRTASDRTAATHATAPASALGTIVGGRRSAKLGRTPMCCGRSGRRARSWAQYRVFCRKNTVIRTSRREGGG